MFVCLRVFRLKRILKINILNSMYISKKSESFLQGRYDKTDLNPCIRKRLNKLIEDFKA